VTLSDCFLDVWIDVQRQWEYLEGIVSGSADIKHLLPVESARFQNINAEFLTVMKKVYKSPFVIDVMNIQGIQKSLERLADLLNKIFHTAEQYVHAQSRLRGLRFHQFGREMKDKYGSCRGLKPDVVGIFGDLPTKLSWNEMEVCVESKLAITDMVRQSGTYARCRLLSNHRRFFSLAMGFQWKSLEAYIFVFHRSGLSSSRPLKVTTPEGFNGLVRHIVGILSFNDEAAYRLDTTRTQNMFCINNLYYKADRLLHVRKTLRGHSTIVYSLRGMYTCIF